MQKPKIPKERIITFEEEMKVKKTMSYMLMGLVVENGELSIGAHPDNNFLSVEICYN
jgi:hypothetical protein